MPDLAPTLRRVLLTVLTLLGALLASPSSALELVVSSGDPVPGGAPGETFDSIYGSHLASDGGIVFHATLQHPTAPRRSGLWRAAPGGEIEAIMISGEAVPGSDPPVVLGAPDSDHVASDSGEVLTWVGRTLVSIDAAGQVTTLVEHGAQIPGAPAGLVFRTSCLNSYNRPPQMTPAGDTAMVVETMEGECEDDVFGTALLVRTRTRGWAMVPMPASVPGAPGATLSDLRSSAIDASGRVVFSGYLSHGGGVDASNDFTIWRWSEAGGFELLFREGDVLPIPGVISPPIRAEGQAAYRVNAAGDVAIEAWWADGVGWHTSIVLVTESGLELVHQTGDRVPGQSRFVFTEISLRALAGGGRPLVLATARDGLGVVRDFEGYWIQDPDGRFALAAGLFMTAPILGEPGAVYEHIDFDPVTNEAGDVVLHSEQIAGPTIEPGESSATMFRRPRRWTRVLVRQGDELEVAPGDLRRVGWGVVGGSGDRFGQRGLDDSGAFVLEVVFGNGDYGLLRGHLDDL